MRNNFFLSVPLLAAIAFSCNSVIADVNDNESSAMPPATSAEDGMPHTHPMIPAGGTVKDLRNEGANDTGADNSTENNDSNAADQDTSNSKQPEIPLVSGGVGEDDLEHLKSIQNQYDLKLLITEDNGTFLSDVSVHIEDKQGRTVVDTTTDGPILLVKLPTGNYKITATRHDETKNTRINVTSGKLRAYQFRFHNTDPRVSGDPRTVTLQ